MTVNDRAQELASHIFEVFGTIEYGKYNDQEAIPCTHESLSIAILEYLNNMKH